MNNKKISNSSGGGMGFLSVLGLIFIVLKLINVIDWPWVWVLAPIWGGFILGIIVVFLIVKHNIKKNPRL